MIRLPPGDQTSKIVYASSVGTYWPGPKDRRVDESWPTHGWPNAEYTRERHTSSGSGGTRTTRAALPGAALCRCGRTYRRAVTCEVRGAFNLAADPMIDAAQLAELLATGRPDLPGAHRCAASRTAPARVHDRHRSAPRMTSLVQVSTWLQIPSHRALATIQWPSKSPAA
jgi:hypothetical protein